MALDGEILITGATGFIGKSLASALIHGGCRVRLFGRNMSRLSDLQMAGATIVHGDLRHREQVLEACEGVDIVFHIGALSSPWGDRTEFFTVNVEGTENVIAGCLNSGVQRLIHVSSPSVVSNGQDQVALPDDAPYPKQFLSIYSETKKLAEDRVNAAFTDGGLTGVILRPKAVFGPGDASLLPRVIAAARASRLPRLGDGRNTVELTYIDNVVRALMLAGTAPRDALNRTFTITNQEPVLLWDVIEKVLSGLEIPWKPMTMPLSVALIAAELMEWKAKVTGGEPLLTRYTVQILARTQTYDTRLSNELLGYAPSVSIAEGIKRTIDAFK